MSDKQERATVEFTTKSGKNTLVLNEYLTGREKRAVKNALWLGKSMQIKDGKGETDPVPMDDIDASTDKTIELIVVSLNGDDKKVLDRVLDLPGPEYDEVIEKIEELTGPVAAEKKDSGNSNTKS